MLAEENITVAVMGLEQEKEAYVCAGKNYKTIVMDKEALERSLKYLKGRRMKPCEQKLPI